MKKGHCEIVVLFDETGSMCNIREDAIGGFNTFLEEQKKVEGSANITLILFNTREYRKEYVGIDIQEAKELVKYKPDAMTNLYDCIGRAINSTTKRLEVMGEDDKPEKVIFGILTDGQENSSIEFDKKKIFDMIKHQQDKHKWEFIYMGANQDAFHEGGAMGIPTHNTQGFMATGQGVRSAYSNMSTSFTSYRAGDPTEE